MALSDDVAILKVEIHKLAVAIEELTIKKYFQGEIDKSKLPWFTPQYVPGDSIKLSGSRLPNATAYLDNNEVIALPSPISVFPNASDKSLGAHQTFDEIPEPSTSLNQARMVRVDLVRETNPCILSKEATISCAHQVFDKIPEPISHLNQVPMLRNNGDNTHNHLIAGSSAMLCVKLAENEALPTLNVNAPDELSSAHNMFDKLPVPTFILEMPQAAKITQENEEMANAHQLFDAMPETTEQAKAGQIICQPAVINNENSPIRNDHNIQSSNNDVVEPSVYIFEENVHSTHEVDVEQGVSLEHKHQLFSKLTALDSPYLRELVTLGADQERFSKLRGALHLANKLLLPDDQFDGNSTPKCSCLQVKNDSLMVLYSLPSMSLVKHVLLPLLLGDKDWLLGSSLSMVLGVDVDKPKVFELEHNWWSHSNFKEVNSWDKRLTCIDYGVIESAIEPLNDGGQILMELILIRRWYMLDICGGGSVSVILVNGILVAIFQLNVDPCTTWISIPYDPGILVIDLSPLVFTYTLEDKSVFRGDEGISRECSWFVLELVALRSNYNASTMRKSVVFFTRVFNPGGLYCQCALRDVHLHDSWFCSELSLELTTGFCVCYFTAYVLDELFSIAWLLLLLNMSHSGICVVILTLNLNHSLEDSGSFEEVRRDSALTRWSKTMRTVQYGGNHRTTSRHFLIHMSVGSFIFDPGGSTCRFSKNRTLTARILKVNTLAFRQYNLKQRKFVSYYESTWVFDPGGNFSRMLRCVDIDFMRQMVILSNVAPLNPQKLIMTWYRSKRGSDGLRNILLPRGKSFKHFKQNLRIAIDDRVTILQPQKCSDVSCFKYLLNL